MHSLETKTRKSPRLRSMLGACHLSHHVVVVQGLSSVASEATGDASVEMDDPDSPSGQLHSTEEEETSVSTSQAERREQQACIQ